jgi:hypothetical protein
MTLPRHRLSRAQMNKQPLARMWLSRALVACTMVCLLVGLALADKVDDLVKRLRDPDNKVRLSAALNLGKLGDRRAVLPLVGALKDPDKTVRGVAAAALGKLIDSGVEAKTRNLAIDALASTAKNDPDAFVRGQAQKAFDAVKGLRGGTGPVAGGPVDLGGKTIYVELGAFADQSGGATSLVPLARRTAEKNLGKEFAVKWPGGRSPSKAELGKAGVSGFFVDGTINKIEVKKSGGYATVKCYVSMLAATYPEKSIFAFANNKKAEVDASGSSDADILEATQVCVEAQVEAMVKQSLMPEIRAKAP